MQIWWNWQTRMIQVHVLHGMEVQILLSAPIRPLIKGLTTKFFLQESEIAVGSEVCPFWTNKEITIRLWRIISQTQNVWRKIQIFMTSFWDSANIKNIKKCQAKLRKT